jgi:hypothetical protein
MERPLEPSCRTRGAGEFSGGCTPKLNAVSGRESIARSGRRASVSPLAAPACVLHCRGLSARAKSVGLLLLLLSVLAVAERVIDRVRSADALAPAEWIWAQGEWRHPRPVGFYAARDFRIDDPADARLLILVDEEFVATLNGKRVARGRYSPGAAVVPVDVSTALRVGSNRIVVEARSARGAGGLRAVIQARGRTLVATDGSWKIFRQLTPGVLRAWAPLDAGESARGWGKAPIGRWDQVRLAARPADAESEDSGAARLLAVTRGRSLAPRTPWRSDWPVESITPALQGASLVDFGKPVEGFLELRYAGEGGALLFISEGLRPPLPQESRPAAVVVRVPGSDVWHDAVGRRVRYVLSVGESRLVGARLIAGAATQPLPSAGLMGIQPPPLRSPVEDKLRREFEGFSRLALGEDG